MSLTARKLTHVSAAEYLAAENDGKWRHEFVNGVVFAMAGASRWHNLIRNRLAATLLGHLAQGCRVFSGEMKLQIKGNADERYYYPDVFVPCDPNDRELYWCSTAVLVVEVLSPSTERIDRFEKFEAYKPAHGLAARILSARQHRHVRERRPHDQRIAALPRHRIRGPDAVLPRGGDGARKPAVRAAE